jgi:membrane-bound lytic murein transglycosylase B
MKRIVSVAVFFAFFLWLVEPSFVHAQTPANAANTASSTGENATSTPPTPSAAQLERTALEQQLAGLEQQIESQQKTVEEYQKQGKTLSGQISTLNAQIAKLNLQIKAVNLKLSQLNDRISDTQTQINQTENQIDTHKDAISNSLRILYESDRETLVAILLSNNNLSDFFGNLNDITLVQSGLRISLEEITKLRQQLLEQKQELSSEKTDAENFKAIQESQQRNVKSTQTQKTTLLKETKGKESEYQKILTKTKATAAQIRSRIFELLGGGELTFAKAYDYAKLAEGATGVRAAIILAILHRESLLGKNVGRCSYKTAMNPTRDIPYFLNLLTGLGIDPSSQSAYVSCANQHGSYGGAMGPAQFIPSTWKLYADAISKVTGNSPANPWNNSDAFAATGLYMKDLLDSKSCKDYANANKNVASYQTLSERCAAAKYYSGGSWYTYRFWYGQPVVDQANNFQDDIDTLNGK